MRKIKLFLQNLFTKFLIAGTLIATILNPIAVKAEVITDGMNPETEIVGTLIETEIDMTFDLMATYTIDPNNKTQKLIADDITASNNGVAATRVSVKFSSNNTLEDILPYELNGLNENSSEQEIQAKWNNIGARLSSRKIALKLYVKEDSVLRAKGQDNIYFKTLKEATAPTYLGDIDAGQSCSWSIDGFHGLAYKEQINTVHKIIWTVELTEGEPVVE